MAVSIRIEVAGCSVVPVVDGDVWSAWPFNDNRCSTLAEWKEHCQWYMARAAEFTGVPYAEEAGWEGVAEEFFATSQASDWRAA